MKVSYIASSGNIYDLTSRIPTREANYHTWEFSPLVTALQYGERVSSFKKGAAVYKAVLVIRGSLTHRKAILTALHDDFENDIRNLTPGRIYFGNWYAECYVISSTTNPDDDVSHWTNNTIEFYIPSGFWVMEETMHFDNAEEVVSEFLDYPYGYEYDYTPPRAAQTIWETDSPFASDFKMEIEGACVNPRVTINGYPYMVNTSVPEGSTLVIDSRHHTVMMGEQNLFDSRNKVQSIFEKIPPGSLSLAWEGFSFTLTLFEERSEPKWL